MTNAATHGNGLPVILLIGGDEPLMDGIARALVEAGASVGRATCARALQAVTAERPDAVLLVDVMADASVLGALTESTRIPVLVLRDSDEAPRGPGNQAVATVLRGEPAAIASRTLTLAKELRPAPPNARVRIRASITTARFGAVSPRDATPAARSARARRSSRLRMIFHTVAEGDRRSELPEPRALERATPVKPSRRRAVVRAMRLPSNRVAPERDLRAVETTRLRSVASTRRYVIVGALVLAALIVLFAFVAHHASGSPSQVSSLTSSP